MVTKVVTIQRMVRVNRQFRTEHPETLSVCHGGQVGAGEGKRAWKILGLRRTNESDKNTLRANVQRYTMAASTWGLDFDLKISISVSN